MFWKARVATFWFNLVTSCCRMLMVLKWLESLLCPAGWWQVIVVASRILIVLFPGYKSRTIPTTHWVGKNGQVRSRGVKRGQKGSNGINGF